MTGRPLDSQGRSRGESSELEDGIAEPMDYTPIGAEWKARAEKAESNLATAEKALKGLEPLWNPPAITPGPCVAWNVPLSEQTAASVRKAIDLARSALAHVKAST